VFQGVEALVLFPAATARPGSAQRQVPTPASCLSPRHPVGTVLAEQMLLLIPTVDAACRWRDVAVAPVVDGLSLLLPVPRCGFGHRCTNGSPARRWVADAERYRNPEVMNSG
jgi:hypothetical protein